MLALISHGYDVRCIMGNHEDMMLQSVRSGVYEDLEEWLENGGDATLDSYGVDLPEDLPEEHVRLLSSLPLYRTTECYVFVHAGIDCSLADPFAAAGREFMLWDRSGKISMEKLGGRRVVSGHSTRTLDQIRNCLKKKHLRLDNGCVYGPGFHGKGNLVALDLGSNQLFVQKNLDVPEDERE